LISWGRAWGVSPMHVHGILAVARESGPAGSVTEDQLRRLACIPIEPTPSIARPRGRVLVALVIWAAAIALAMHLV